MHSPLLPKSDRTHHCVGQGPLPYLLCRTPEIVNLYLTQKDYLGTALKQSGNEKQTLETLRDFLVTEKPQNFDDCIEWARMQFEKQYNNAIQQLLYNFPKDSKTASGQPFWSGPKRAPDPLKFDPNDPTHYGFVLAAQISQPSTTASSPTTTASTSSPC